ncbi:18819_t:CDS:2, partial [Entrophospora sp. SA101]
MSTKLQSKNTDLAQKHGKIHYEAQIENAATLIGNIASILTQEVILEKETTL